MSLNDADTCKIRMSWPDGWRGQLHTENDRGTLHWDSEDVWFEGSNGRFDITFNHDLELVRDVGRERKRAWLVGACILSMLLAVTAGVLSGSLVGAVGPAVILAFIAFAVYNIRQERDWVQGHHEGRPIAFQPVRAWQASETGAVALAKRIARARDMEIKVSV